MTGNRGLVLTLIYLLYCFMCTTEGGVRFSEIQNQYLQNMKPQYRGNHNGNGNTGGDNGNGNGNCYGNCADNVAGNNNGNANHGTGNGNNNGNCFGNCVGNVIGNYNGNRNVNGYYNGNENGNCRGNCYHNTLGNYNGHRSQQKTGTGNYKGLCRGNCFHLKLGNGLQDDNSDGSISNRFTSPQQTSCAGNCFPDQQPGNAYATKTEYNSIETTPLTCQGKDGFNYYIGPDTYCVEVWRSAKRTRPSRTHCGKGEAFDLDICACNHWLLVSVLDTCRSGAGRY